MQDIILVVKYKQYFIMIIINTEYIFYSVKVLWLPCYYEYKATLKIRFQGKLTGCGLCMYLLLHPQIGLAAAF